MKLFIPEIGTQLKLTSDWKFNLHAESRNASLGEIYDYIYFCSYNPDHNCNGNVWLSLNDTTKVPILDYSTVQYPSWDEIERKSKSLCGLINYYDAHTALNEARRKAEEASPELQASLKIWNEWYEKLKVINKYPHIEVNIPKNSILKVDRIYIRKGNKDYSSISFYWNDNPTKKKIRFWAKLDDCNNIECDVI